jgi:hypothetical protein
MMRRETPLLRATEALTVLRAMLADAKAFDEAIFNGLALRATKPIADKRYARNLYESFMACYGILLFGDHLDRDVPPRLLREANWILDDIEMALT